MNYKWLFVHSLKKLSAREAEALLGQRFGLDWVRVSCEEGFRGYWFLNCDGFRLEVGGAFPFFRYET